MSRRFPTFAGMGRDGSDVTRDGAFWMVSLWLAVVFMTGGSARADVWLLTILRPVSALMLGVVLYRLTGEQARRNRWLLVLAAATVLLPIVQLIPLPPDIWRALPGRDLIAEIDGRAGLGPVWRPLTMAPEETWNALWSLMAPLATLLLALQLDARQRVKLLAAILVIGCASALLGLLQILGDPQGPLYYYPITGNGQPVGLFANRNHQAAFLAVLFPVMMAWAMARHPSGVTYRAQRRWIAALPVIGLSAIIILLILLTGSRSGMLLALVALVSLHFVYSGSHVRKDGERRGGWLWLLLLGLGVLATVAIQLGRGAAMNRLLTSDPMGDTRVQIAPTVVDMISATMPWGIGLGSFQKVYLVHERSELLRPFYMNHVHNDWLELALTGGVPAMLLVVVALIAYGVRLTRTLMAGAERGEELVMRRLGLVMLLLLALASVTDYPLRTPALACLAAIAIVLAFAAPAASRAGNGAG